MDICDNKIRSADIQKKINELCAKYSVDPEFFFVGIARKTSKNRLGYNFGNRKGFPNPKFRFIVEYYPLYKIYLIWNRSKYSETVYSILLSSVEHALASKLQSVQKHIQYSGWGEETVYIFDLAELEKFIELLSLKKENNK